MQPSSFLSAPEQRLLGFAQSISKHLDDLLRTRATALQQAADTSAHTWADQPSPVPAIATARQLAEVARDLQSAAETAAASLSHIQEVIKPDPTNATFRKTSSSGSNDTGRG